MTTTKQKLEAIITQNVGSPLLLEGLQASNFPTAVVIPATTPSSELGIVPTADGYQYPKWLMSILVKAKAGKRLLLCIDGLEQITFDEQAKFIGLLEHYSLNGYHLPADTQIILPVTELSKVSPRIQSLSLIYRVGAYA